MVKSQIELLMVMAFGLLTALAGRIEKLRAKSTKTNAMAQLRRFRAEKSLDWLDIRYRP
jgi:hypothetical protein